MVNLAEKHEEDSSAQLADAEISRILTALQKAEFKRSESGNARPSDLQTALIDGNCRNCSATG